MAAGGRGWPAARSAAAGEFCRARFALHELNALRARGLTRHGLLAFHSRYKLQLLAHHQAGYREIGPFVASLHEWEDLEAFFEVYREKLMAILKRPASRKTTPTC